MFRPEAEGWKEIPVRAFFRRIGPLYARRTSESWEYGLLTTEEHDNSAGIVHGGVLAAFADQVLSTVAWEAAGRRPASTVSLDLQFAGPVIPGQFVVVQGRVVRAGASLIFLTGLLTCDSRDVVSASGVWNAARP
jgi:acyl-coenzyme A thioesterase PaaI-like protein